MENIATNGQETRKRQVGSFKRIPIFDLEDAIDVAKFVSDTGAGKLDIDSLAEVMEYSNTTILHHINSAKHHNIIISNSGTIELTDIGRGIANPTSEEELIDCKIKAFLSCGLYNQAYIKYKGMNLPKPEILGNIFARDEGISFKTKDRTARNFIKSGVLVGLIKENNGVFYCIESIDQESVIEENESEEYSKTEVMEVNESAKTDVKTTQSSDKIKISTDPFFELYIKPDEAAFDALMQLLPHYKKIYCKVNDNSL